MCGVATVNGIGPRESSVSRCRRAQLLPSRRITPAACPLARSPVLQYVHLIRLCLDVNRVRRAILGTSLAPPQAARVTSTKPFPRAVDMVGPRGPPLGRGDVRWWLWSGRFASQGSRGMDSSQRGLGACREHGLIPPGRPPCYAASPPSLSCWCRALRVRRPRVTTSAGPVLSGSGT